MGEVQQTVGCTDIYATNYDITATLPCSSCCQYPVTKNIVGCMDRLANNYNVNATKPCTKCCRYDKPTNPSPVTNYLTEIPLGPLVPKYPYDINPEGAICIRDIESFNTEWTITNGSNTFYDLGWEKYKESLEQVVYGTNPPTIPNWDSSGTMSQIWTAFDILLIHKPNSRVFINNLLFTPWIIPLYANDDLLIENPNKQRFINDCNNVGGEIYIYQESGDVTLINLEHELVETQKEQSQAQQDYDNYHTYLNSLNRQTTPEELIELQRLGGILNDINKIVLELESNIKITKTDVQNNSYVKNHFVACLCNNTDLLVPVKCKTTSIKGDTYSISPTRAECVKNYDKFINFITQNLTLYGTLNPNGSYMSTTYFNSYVLTELGIPQDDAEFIMVNYNNFTPAYYPLNSNTLDTINGTTRSREIIKKAFLNGANIWLPLSSDLSTDIIKDKECCDLVGGIYKEGSYQPNPPNKDRKTTGVCLCNEITQPCPTLIDGSLSPITEVIETSSGTITTTYINVGEECCSNASLQSRMAGNWTWSDGRCILLNEEDTNTCQESTILTISETPISIKDLRCNNNTVTISAYIYFEEPNNRCTDGELTPDNPPLTNDVINLYRNPPQTTGEVSIYSQQKGLDATTSEPSSTGSEATQTTNCCYDTSTPIEGLLIIQDINHVKIDTTTITYVDTFNSTQTTINTNAGIGTGFNRWIKLTTIVDISSLTPTTTFNVAVEFTQGLFKCCNYDIYFDDIEVGCLQTGVREIYNTEKCPGFELRHVIDNKKSWVYNPGTNTMGNSVEDNIIRTKGTNGMNVAQSSPLIIDGGHGAINRVFAPSVDAELQFRDTDYFGFHGVIERHSKLVLNSKEVMLTFNMCPDGDCAINPIFLIDDDGGYILDDDGGRIIVGTSSPFPNLLQLETFKKTFQGFWVQFMEQFIPATTIFVSGEKWCNSRICSVLIVSDYLLAVENNSGVLSPTPTTNTVTDTTNTPEPNTREQSTPVTETSGAEGPTEINGEIGTTNSPERGPIIVGNTKIYSLEALDPEEASSVKYSNYTT